MKIRQIALWAATGAAIAMGLGSMAQAAEVNVYSARKEELIKPLLQKFTEQTGVTVNLVTAEDDVLLERLKAEGESSPADILITADAGRLRRADQSGLLQPVTSAQLVSSVPARLRQAQGNWYGLTVRARVFAYSPERVKLSEMSTYEGLADAHWKGRLCARSSSNVYNQSLTASLLSHNGAEKTAAWLTGMVANFARPPQGGDRDQIKDIASGKCDIALVNTYYVGGMLNSKDPAEHDAAAKIAIFWPNQADRGTHVNVSGAGVTKSAQNKAAAIQLMEFMVTDASQQWYADVNNEYPIRDSIPLSKTLAAWGSFKSDPLDMAVLGDLNAQALMAMDRAGWK